MKSSMTPNPNDPGLKPPLYPGGKSYSDAPLAASNAISTGGFVDAGYRPRNAANPSAMDMLLAGGWNPSKQDINSHFDKLVEQEKQKLMQELPGQTPEFYHQRAVDKITREQGDEASGRLGIGEGLAFQRMQQEL